ncbi:MAG: MBOAT family protein [Leptospira sp.]|nr:MBOAT family protein [Leptospira sp.]
MLFNSPLFAIFLAIVLIGVWAFRIYSIKYNQLSAGINRLKGLKIVLFLIILSAVFYAAWNPLYLLLLLWVSLFDFWIARVIYRSVSSTRKRIYLVISLGNSLGILIWFKYSLFIAENMAIIGLNMGSYMPIFQSIVLPVGISFYTFQSISYVVDVYRGELPPEDSYPNYLLFLLFFPQLVAGPIVTAKSFLPQIRRSFAFSDLPLAFGFFLILLGLFKKLILADHLALPSDYAFQNVKQLDSLSLWIGLLSYSFQIYCDFSGYTDIAQGSALMLGYQLPENFRMPYLSKGFSEFWTRWHISLSSWLRDYLYIPLGGNRLGRLLTIRNLVLVMVLGGLWHGASWNFFIWGFCHGLLLVLERFFRSSSVRPPIPFEYVSNVLMISFTFFAVTILWIPFRSPNFETSLWYLQGLFVKNAEFSLPYSYQMNFFYSFILITIGHFFGKRVFNTNEQMLDLFKKHAFSKGNLGFLGFSYAIVLILIVLYSAEGLPFVYFVF